MIKGIEMTLWYLVRLIAFSHATNPMNIFYIFVPNLYLCLLLRVISHPERAISKNEYLGVQNSRKYTLQIFYSPRAPHQGI